MLYGLVPPFGHIECAAMAANPTSENFYDFVGLYCVTCNLDYSEK
jgi:hypothetical protein